jgi:hypothetical protein
MSTGIDKLEIADEMMESAIENFLDKHRYYSSLNLAGVAQEIYGKWIRINGGKDLPSQTLDNMEKLSKISDTEFNRKKWKEIGGHHKNTIKHFDSASDRYAILDPHFESYIQLVEAFAEHKRLKRPITENIKRFGNHIKLTRGHGNL